MTSYRIFPFNCMHTLQWPVIGNVDKLKFEFESDWKTLIPGVRSMDRAYKLV
jgi:hypothetical protein